MAGAPEVLAERVVEIARCWPRIIESRLAPPKATAGTRMSRTPARRRDSRAIGDAPVDSGRI